MQSTLDELTDSSGKLTAAHLHAAKLYANARKRVA